MVREMIGFIENPKKWNAPKYCFKMYQVNQNIPWNQSAVVNAHSGMLYGHETNSAAYIKVVGVTFRYFVLAAPLLLFYYQSVISNK